MANIDKVGGRDSKTSPDLPSYDSITGHHVHIRGLPLSAREDDLETVFHDPEYKHCVVCFFGFFSL
jgi:hypothetical protein